MNPIYLRRRSRLLLDKTPPAPDEAGAVVTAVELAAIQAQAEELGYVLSDAVVERLGGWPLPAVTQMGRLLLKTLRQMTGAHRPHRPLYPDFPRQVQGLDDAQRYLDAIHHYLTLRRMPGDGSTRPPLLHGRSPRIIELGDAADCDAIFTQLAASATSLSDEDRDDLSWYVKQYRADIFRLIPEQIPFKENLAHLAANLLRHVPGPATDEFLRQRIDTATDVLRLAVAMAGGDASLAAPARFKSMPRSRRKLLLSLIERHPNAAEDMRRWGERWKRLGEYLHPGEFAERYPRTYAAFGLLRSGKPAPTFNSAVEGLLADGQIHNAVTRLESRPGELARRMDHLLRTAADPATVLAGFARVADQVSTPVLLQLYTHAAHRGGPTPLRTFYPKGDVAKVYAIADARAPLPEGCADALAALCKSALLTRFAALPPLGECYVDPALREHTAPLAQRSASRSLRTLGRGSSLPLPDADFVRLFLWWKNGSAGRADVDLSAAMFGPDFNFIDALTYYQLQSYGGYHSGDIVDAPDGAAEFIDLNLERLRGRGVRFVVMVLNSYTLQPYCDLAECFAGWMSRQDTNSGEPFEPRTVMDRIDLASNTQISLPLVLDLQDRCVRWMDVALRAQPRMNNVKNNLSGVSLMLRALLTRPQPDLHTLFTLHAQARGRIIEDVEAAQTVFSVSAGITPFDTDRIRADFL
ncbi:TerD family protein [Achromobacter seleniivolatilans]|uniref:TerD family protein n=1 Tax=Achromobacter seleniivolatilans TaxID=3047478 RepID=A0ABY9M5Y5_9BURK|nr:TerD family protein [Achromobacter sp. R39]WMD22355.1 TerD family protein [Achromobacter sp. R39]